MDFGIALSTSGDTSRGNERAEAPGSSNTWLYETQLLNAECPVATRAGVGKTSRIRFATDAGDAIEDWVTSSRPSSKP